MMKNPITSWRYLFKLPVNFYNNKEVGYEISPLPYSDQDKVIVFAGNNDRAGGQSIVYIYLELSKELNDGNRFANLQRLLNLIYMETGLPIHDLPVQINKKDSIDDMLSKFTSKSFYSPGVSYSGTAPQPNHIARVQWCVEALRKLSNKDFIKFDNALNTYAWALELRELPNPHLKYTLYMTLFLSAINQLADNPKYCENHPTCTKCKKELRHQLKGEKQSIEDLMRELLTGEALDQGVSKFKKLYSELRSSFLHAGKLSGREREGGFLFDFRGSGNLIVDEMELLITCRQLFEQFLIKRQKNENRTQ